MNNELITCLQKHRTKFWHCSGIFLYERLHLWGVSVNKRAPSVAEIGDNLQIDQNIFVYIPSSEHLSQACYYLIDPFSYLYFTLQAVEFCKIQQSMISATLEKISVECIYLQHMNLPNISRKALINSAVLRPDRSSCAKSSASIWFAFTSNHLARFSATFKFSVK